MSRSLEPTKPNFQSSLRAAAVADTRCGSGRRGGSTGSMPRQARNLPYGNGAPDASWAASGRAGRYEPSASVARNNSTSAPSARTTSASTCPGSACSSSADNSNPGCAAAALPTTPERSSITWTPSSLPPTARATRWFGATTAAAATSLAVRSADASAEFQACTPSGTYVISLNFSSQTRVRSSPGARQRSTNSSVTLAEPRNSATTAAELSSTDDERRRRVTAGRLLPAPGQSRAHVGGDDERGLAGTGQSEQQRARSRAHRGAEVERGCRRGQA